MLSDLCSHKAHHSNNSQSYLNDPLVNGQFISLTWDLMYRKPRKSNLIVIVLRIWGAGLPLTYLVFLIIPVVSVQCFVFVIRADLSLNCCVRCVWPGRQGGPPWCLDLGKNAAHNEYQSENQGSDSQIGESDTSAVCHPVTCEADTQVMWSTYCSRHTFLWY